MMFDKKLTILIVVGLFAGASLVAVALWLRKVKDTGVGLNTYYSDFIKPATTKVIQANHLLPEDAVIHRLDAIYKPGSVVKRKTID